MRWSVKAAQTATVNRQSLLWAWIDGPLTTTGYFGVGAWFGATLTVQLMQLLGYVR